MRQPCRDRSAFTLVEMLVAFAVGALVLVSLASIVSQSLAVSRKTNNTLLANNAATAAVEMISTDLESLAVSRRGYEYLQTIKEDVDGVKDVTRLLLLGAGGGDGTSNGDYGQVRAISYRLLNQDPISAGGSRKVYGLYRSVASAGDTFTKFLGQPDLSVPFGSVSASLDDFVVGNVVDFQIRFLPAGNVGATNVSGTSVQPVRISGNRTLVNGSAYSGPPLAWAEVSLTVLEDRDNALGRLEAGSLSLADARNQYGFRLTRRVPLRIPL